MGKILLTQSSLDMQAIHRLQLSDIKAGLALTEAEGWPHTAADWYLHFQLGKGWGMVNGDGQLLGTAVWWPQGARAGTLGLVVVRRSARGRGIAAKLVDAALAEAGQRRMRLVATPAAQPLYRRRGFEDLGAVRQFQGNLKAGAPAGETGDLRVRPVEESDFGTLCDLDARAQGAPRRPLIKALMARSPGCIGERDGRAVGFALVREAGRGRVIGPVAAPGPDEAQEVIAPLLRSCPDGSHLRIDIPDPVDGLVAWLGTWGLEEVDQGFLMARGGNPAEGCDLNSYGLASQAFG